MILSAISLELCAEQYDQGPLIGLSMPEQAVTPTLTEGEAEKAFDELTRSGLLEFTASSARLSPYAQAIMAMMVSPDICVVLANGISGVRANLYVRDTYYLCVLSNEHYGSSSRSQRYQVDLLLDLKSVVGLFAYVIHLNAPHDVETNGPDRDSQPQLSVRGMAWDERRRLINSWGIDGHYRNEGILCSISEAGGEDTRKEEPRLHVDSMVINMVTEWLFGRLSDSIAMEAEIEESAQWA